MRVILREALRKRWMGHHEIKVILNVRIGKDMCQKLKLVVVGAHPDDPETAAGGTMALFSQAGHEVVSAYLTRGEAGIHGKSHRAAAHIRTEEAEKACEILNVKPVFLGQIDGACEINKARYAEMYQFLEDQAPGIVITHWPVDTHRDHRVCSSLVYDAWLRLKQKPALYYFEVMSGMQTQNFHPAYYVDIGSVLDLKHKACFAHKSQHIQQNYARDHGKMEPFRGLEAGCEYAEAFVLQSLSPRIPLL